MRGTADLAVPTPSDNFLKNKNDSSRYQGFTIAAQEEENGAIQKLMVLVGLSLSSLSAMNQQIQ